MRAVAASSHGIDERLNRFFEAVEAGLCANQHFHTGLNQLMRGFESLVKFFHALFGAVHAFLSASHAPVETQFHLVLALGHCMQQGFDALETFFDFGFHQLEVYQRDWKLRVCGALTSMTSLS